MGFLYLPLPLPIFKLSLMCLNELASFDFRNDQQAGQVSENKISDSERRGGIFFFVYMLCADKVNYLPIFLGTY